MAIVTVTRTIDAPPERVFATWSDEFADVYKFHPGLKASHALGDRTGQGATRQCDLADGKNWLRERVVRHVPGRELGVDIYESSLPLKSARADIQFEPAGRSRTKVTFTIAFTPGMGPIGFLMTPMMKADFRKTMRKLLDANAAYVERGAQANPTLAVA